MNSRDWNVSIRLRQEEELLVCVSRERILFPNPLEFSFARWAENTKSGTHSSGPVEEADVHGSER